MTGASVIIPRRSSATTTRAALETVLPLFAAAVVFAVGALVIDGQPIGALRDDSMYVMLGKSIASGHGYRWLNLPGIPPATHFPPGYPAVLALLWLLAPAFPANILLFKLANTVFAALAAAGVARFVKTRFDLTELGAQLFAMSTMVAVPMLGLIAQVMSEPLFLALLVATLLFAERLVGARQPHWGATLGLGLMAGATMLVRTNGVALLPAIALVLCLRRRFRDATIFAATMIATALPWQLWAAVHANELPPPMRGNYESYTALIGDALHARGIGFLGAVASRTAHDMSIMFQYLVAPSGLAGVRLVALTILIVLAALGARPMWRRSPVSTLFLALYSVIILFWPYTPGRFVWCVWPFVVLLPVLGARAILAWSPPMPSGRLARAGGLAAAALLSLGYAAYNLNGYRAGTWTTDGYANRLRPLLVQVATRTPPNALLATEAENTVFLYTGRQTVPIGSFMATDYLEPRDSRELARGFEVILDRYHPAAVVVSTGFLRAAMGELVTRDSPLLAVVDSFPGGGVVLAPLHR